MVIHALKKKLPFVSDQSKVEMVTNDFAYFVEDEIIPHQPRSGLMNFSEIAFIAFFLQSRLSQLHLWISAHFPTPNEDGSVVCLSDHCVVPRCYVDDPDVFLWVLVINEFQRFGLVGSQ